MTFGMGWSYRNRNRSRPDNYVFEWSPTRSDRGPIFRDLSWDFEEPDHYPALVAAQKPGMLASKGEKEVHAAVASGDPDAILHVAGGQPKYGDIARAIAGLLLLETELVRGIGLLEEVVANDREISKDHFVRKYLAEAGLTVDIAAGVMVHLPLQRNSLLLLLAELHQVRGEGERALQLLATAEPTTHVRLSQTELLYEAGDYDRVLELTEGVVNDDDVTALQLAYRGRALAELGRLDEAIAVLARALEFPNRAASLKAIALVGRGLIHQQRGEHILAQNDFTQALMEVPNDREAQEHIEQLIRGENQ